MKHTPRIILILVSFFFIAQVVGLLIINQYIDHKRTAISGETVMKPLPYGFERPEIENKSVSFIYILFAILTGTLLIFLLVRFNKPLIWKFWYLLTVWLTLSIAFSAFIDRRIAAVIALALAVLKLYRPGIIIQNASEIFIYGGLAAFFVNMFNLFAAFLLLISISVYDYISVFKTKHMITLANFQSKSSVFAGLFIPYGKKKGHSAAAFKAYKVTAAAPVKSRQAPAPDSGQSVAVLGGGDIGFTLLFAGVVMKDLMLREPFLTAFLKTLVIPVLAAIALMVLLAKGKQNKFYPAMPFLSIACFAGWLIGFFFLGF